MRDVNKGKKRIEELRETVNYHNYRYYVLDAKDWGSSCRSVRSCRTSPAFVEPGQCFFL
jgi:hypothetical protein